LDLVTVRVGAAVSGVAVDAEGDGATDGQASLLVHLAGEGIGDIIIEFQPARREPPGAEVAASLAKDAPGGIADDSTDARCDGLLVTDLATEHPDVRHTHHLPIFRSVIYGPDIADPRVAVVCHVCIAIAESCCGISSVVVTTGTGRGGKAGASG